MATVTITNIDDIPAHRYGVDFPPGARRKIDIEVVNAYSLMEISHALQYIVKNMSREEPKIIVQQHIVGQELKKRNYFERIRDKVRFRRQMSRLNTKGKS